MLYGTSLILIRASIPIGSATDSGAWLDSNATAVELALNLVPYAGIAFLWFIGVVRDRLGSLEDRFFATVMLGSGLLFLAMTFTGAALAGGFLTSYAMTPNTILQSGIYTYGREVMFHLINVYAIRMAGVFMISLGTIWIRSGLMPRGWPILTYVLAVVLLVTISFSLWVTMIFPGWVFAVSLYLLVRHHSDAAQDTLSEGSAT